MVYVVWVEVPEGKGAFEFPTAEDMLMFLETLPPGSKYVITDKDNIREVKK